jgi:hypothetical protein
MGLLPQKALQKMRERNAKVAPGEGKEDGSRR